MSLGSDAMTRFREEREEHYRLFGISAVIAPSDWKAPDFLTEAENNGKYRKWRPPHQPAYFDVISVPFAATCNRARFHQLNSAWLEGLWPGRRIHWALDFDGRAGHLPRLPDDRETLHQGPATGRVLVSKRQGEEYSATVETADPAFLLFKMSFHPGWRARVNGRETSTFLVTPGFLAIPVPEGKSGVVLRYEPERWRAFLLLLGLLLLAGTFLAGRRVASGWKHSGRADRLRDFLEGISKWLRSHPAEVTLLLLVYYPGWQVRLDGRPLVIDVYSPTGLIRFEVPSGSHELSIDFERSSVQTAGGLVTVGAAAFFLLWMAGLPTGRRPGRKSPLPPAG